ncbi:hypothetical protein FVEN_g12915 [Fusarium venenatum]|uniref:Uncharacterized protein n=1 Tax=Fusarium venenatum TaxID=56646 RepID=A0A2L2TB31_9HYPO|nr:uncharacterized protein FVRRES_04572 [Fusarium venenatum]KAG8353860.1 hypothetical protein FVEN_g12915 [Fusarium venenatum]CEI60136.1 unnamed protein product [Fusarium venenatum]
MNPAPRPDPNAHSFDWDNATFDEAWQYNEAKRAKEEDRAQKAEPKSEAEKEQGPVKQKETPV